MTRIAVFGATSAIAMGVVKLYAEQKQSLYLVGRDPDKVAIITRDSAVRGAPVLSSCYDFSSIDGIPHLVEKVWNELGGIDIALIAHGMLPDQESCLDDPAKLQENITVNFTSAALLATQIANKMADNKQNREQYATIAVIGSVAGDRGRKSNFCYGAAKGALDLFLGGLRGKMSPHGVHILTIKPGFVDTPMTEAIKKGPLFSSVTKVAKDIEHAIRKQRNILYTPWFWRFIMLVIKTIPEAIFKRLSI